MAENETGTVAQEQEATYSIKVEDAGPATKKVTIEIPRERITTKLAEQFKELRQEAAIPGFRKGHAPQKLIEKKFSTDVRSEVCRALVSESYQQAIEKNSLNVLGEPEFDNPDAITLPEEGPLSYSFQVEIQPEIILPELKGIKVNKPKVEVTEEHVNQAVSNLCTQQGTMVPVEDRGVAANDYLVADVEVKADGNTLNHFPDGQFVVKANGVIGGFPVANLDKQLEGTKSGETRTLTVKIPDTYATETLRGKDVQLDVRVKDIKRLEPVELDEEFLSSLGFANEQEVRDALREQMVQRIQADVQRTMRQQVIKYLLDNVGVVVPARLSSRQAERVVNRRAMDLLMRGIPEEQIRTNIERLKTGAEDEAVSELKSFFILQKVAEQQKVDVSEGELNGRIAMIAMQQGRRPEKLKQEMAKDNSLSNLYVQMREEKALDIILEQAEITEVDAPTTAPAEGGEKSEPSAT